MTHGARQEVPACGLGAYCASKHAGDVAAAPSGHGRRGLATRLPFVDLTRKRVHDVRKTNEDGREDVVHHGVGSGLGRAVAEAALEAGDRVVGDTAQRRTAESVCGADSGRSFGIVRSTDAPASNPRSHRTRASGRFERARRTTRVRRGPVRGQSRSRIWPPSRWSLGAVGNIQDDPERSPRSQRRKRFPLCAVAQCPDDAVTRLERRLATALPRPEPTPVMTTSSRPSSFCFSEHRGLVSGQIHKRQSRRQGPRRPVARRRRGDVFPRACWRSTPRPHAGTSCVRMRVIGHRLRFFRVEVHAFSSNDCRATVVPPADVCERPPPPAKLLDAHPLRTHLPIDSRKLGRAEHLCRRLTLLSTC